MSKSSINAFLTGEFGKKRREGTRFKNADALFDIIDKINVSCDKNDWFIEEFEEEVTYTTSGVRASQQMFTIHFRNPVTCLRQILRHVPFASDLSYQPVKKFRDGKRVYNEMNTADWWWETQHKIPEGGTVIPIMFSTDKTLLTEFSGDRTAWPVYMTTGNLSKKARRHQKRPGWQLVGLLPVVKDIDFNSKCRLYHKAMGIIFQGNAYIQYTGGIPEKIPCTD